MRAEKKLFYDGHSDKQTDRLLHKQFHTIELEAPFLAAILTYLQERTIVGFAAEL